MKISHDIPAIYHRCHEKFGVNWSQGVIITYGDTVYCKYPLTPDKVVHEGTHVRQQTEMDKDEWWDKYMKDEDFRLSQELEAYKAEVKWLKKNVKDREKLFKLIHKVCLDISSPMYGNIITYNEAKKAVIY